MPKSKKNHQIEIPAPKSNPIPKPEPQLIEDDRSIEERIADATKELELAKEIQTRAKIEEEEATQVKQECSGEMARATPLIQDITDSLNSIKRSDISQLKSMQNPPPLVKTVFAAVCVLKGIKPQEVKDERGKKVKDYWGPSKKMMADYNFLQSLKDFDRDNVPPEVMAELQNSIRAEGFVPKMVSKISNPAGGLCTWVRAVNAYQEIAPVKNRLLQAEKTLKETALLLMAKTKEIEELEEKLAQLNVQYLARNENLTTAAPTIPRQSSAKNDQSTEPAEELKTA